MLNDKNRINDNEVINIAEWNLPHDILNYSKQTKNVNSQYFHIIHGCMNTHRGELILKNFRMLLDSGCIYTIAIRMLITNLTTKKDDVFQRQTQAVNITTTTKAKIDFTLP